MWFTASLAMAVVAAQVADRLPPAPAGSVALEGLLGQRVRATAEHRLLGMDEDILLGGFRRRPGNHPWIGEHVGKFLHAATLAWTQTGDPRLREKIDRVTTGLIACQLEDGYLGTYVPEEYWTSWDVWSHKYCLYGLLTVWRQTGREDALAAARRIGDLLCRTFGEQPGQRDIIAAGTHVGMAATSVMEPMMMLHAATGDARYLEFCEYLVRAWDQPHGPKVLASLLEHGKVNRTANGKAYEMMSNLVGLCELYRATGRADYLTACRRAWDDILANQCYVTGGTSLGEHFQEDGFLPNNGSVSENCAQVTWEQLTAQLLRLTGEAKYAELLERLVYCHLIGSQRPDLSGICYFTPLEGTKPFGDGVNCCTSSNPRGIMMMPGFAWCATPTEVTALVHGPGSVRVPVDGQTVVVRQLADYPNAARLDFRVDAERPIELTLRVRQPAWATAMPATVGGRAIDAVPADGFLTVRRTWQPGDQLSITLDMPIEVVRDERGNPGRRAVRRGPVVYAFDAADAPDLPFGVVGLADEPAPALAAGRITGGWANALPIEAPAVLPARFGGEPRTMRLRPFVDAGISGSRYATWLPDAATVAALPFNLLMTGTESWSRDGNVAGSLIDGDLLTWRVTWNAQPADEDWYAVTLAAATRLTRVVYAHGNLYHDGGWFDAAAGKPRIEIRRTADGDWELLGELTSYPATTAVDSAGLRPGQLFELRCPPTEVVAVRIVGKPATGDNANQAFSSCAELQAYDD